MDCIIKVAKENGTRTLWSGSWPSFLRNAPWNAAFFLVYEYVFLRGLTLDRLQGYNVSIN